MNITSTNSIDLKTDDTQIKQAAKKDNSSNFSDELKNLKGKEDAKKAQTNETKKSDKENSKEKVSDKKDKSKDVDKAINGLNDTLDELSKLSQKDESDTNKLKNNHFFDDIKNKQEVSGLIDNNINLQEQQDKFNMQMNANMNFNSNGQPFAEFVNQDKNNNPLNSSSHDLAEEKAIMSTMEENIAIANKNMAMSRTKTVESEKGVHKIDKKTNLVVDTVVNYDSVIVSKEDAEFFINLVDNNLMNLTDIKNSEKSSRVSKALADLLAKAMNDNKPIRIDFDNDISVIIKIDRAGKISADFLPSSQVAEAYLKENLPLLKQRFDENDIDYNELNQRERKQDTQDNNRKKERKDE